MTPSKIKCPECDLTFDVPAGVSGTVACPICETACPISTTAPVRAARSVKAAAPRPAPVVAAPTATDVMASPDRSSPPIKAPRTMPLPVPNRSTGSGRRVVLAAVILGGGLFLSVGIGLAAYVVRASSAPKVAEAPAPQEPAVVAPVADVPHLRPVERPVQQVAPKPENVAPGPIPPRELAVVEPQAEPKAADPKPGDPKPMPAKELSDDEIKVNEAVERGTKYLHRWLDEEKPRPAPAARPGRPGLRGGGRVAAGHELGTSALIGLTLLECGVPAEDKHVAELAKTIRAARATLDHTYSLALAIFFLDRLGDPRDRDLIETFALRLVAGQTAIGSWSYTCPILSPSDQLKFAEYLKANAYVVPDSRPAAKPVGVEKLPTRAKATAVVSWQRGVKVGNVGGPMGGDNSNAQFALLGLWVAKRQGAPVQPSLAFVERHFRTSATADGGWGYHRPPPMQKNMALIMGHSTASMTCAGLLGLAVGRGVNVQMADDKDPKAPAADAGINKGFRALETHLRPVMAAAVNNARAHTGARDLYLYWSIERVAMIYDLKMLGGKEWYPTLAKHLVAAQQADGSWDPAVHNTCFALLVLRRANVAKDLTSSLKSSLNIKDLNPQVAPAPNR